MAKPTQLAATTSLLNRVEWKGVLGYNEMLMRIEARTATPWGYIGPWDDIQDTLLVIWYEQNGIHVSRELAVRAVEVAAYDGRFNPLTLWLNSIVWDRSLRVNRWLTRYAGVEDSHYTRAVGEKWLISAVARAFQSGCKVDTCLILQGNQGIGKSKLLKTLAGDYFTDEISDFGSKDAALQMQSAWIIELAELDNLSKGEASRIKAFMSRGTDRFRPPYGRHVVDSPRHCIFAGTVNPSEFLKDETGSRRFWPVICGEIDIESVKRDRDQLWAEAVDLYKSGATWWLDDASILLDAEEQQKQHFDHDVWYSRIASFVKGRDEVTIDQVLEIAVDRSPDQWNHSDKTRVGKCLTMLGGKSRKRNGEKIYDFTGVHTMPGLRR